MEWVWRQVFPRVQGFWETVRLFIPRLCFFFFKLEIISRTLLPLFRPRSVHCGSANWDDCDRVFPDELRVSSFPDRFSLYAWTRVYAGLGATCHLHNDWGLLRATAVTRGCNGHRIKVSTQSWLWKRKFSRRSCRDSNSQPFRSRARSSNRCW